MTVKATLAPIGLALLLVIAFLLWGSHEIEDFDSASVAPATRQSSPAQASSRATRPTLAATETVPLKAQAKSPESMPEAPADEAQISRPDPTTVSDTKKQTDPAPALKSALKERRVSKLRLRNEGGSEGTELSVRCALEWLARHQFSDGSWSTEGWSSRCESRPCTSKEPARNTARLDRGVNDVGLTALAALAFLGNGQSSDAAERALSWLVNQQLEDGRFKSSAGAMLLNHAFATLAFCEALAMTGNPSWRVAAAKALDFTLQQGRDSHWPRDSGFVGSDLVVTGWVLAAVRAASDTDLKIPPSLVPDASAWVRSLDKSPAANPDPIDSASAILIQRFDEIRITALAPEAERLLEAAPEWTGKSGDAFTWNRGSCALFQLGGIRWRDWNKRLQKALLPTQRIGGEEDGSWDPVREESTPGARVLVTALHALSLETYTRYPRCPESQPAIERESTR